MQYCGKTILLIGIIWPVGSITCSSICIGTFCTCCSSCNDYVKNDIFNSVRLFRLNTHLKPSTKYI